MWVFELTMSGVRPRSNHSLRTFAWLADEAFRRNSLQFRRMSEQLDDAFQQTSCARRFRRLIKEAGDVVNSKLDSIKSTLTFIE
ncbi:MAG: hypothetical protein ACXWFY_04125 [Chthoniobacterales bacterium]